MSASKSKSKDKDSILSEILNEVKSLRKMQEDLHIEQAKTDELCHLMFRILNDISAKKDIEICALNLKNAVPKTSKKKPTEKKQFANIMAYFKHKYQEDPSSIYDIIDEKEIEEVLARHEDELKSKKKGNNEAAKPTIIYKEFISGNKTNQNRLRSKKEADEEKLATQSEEVKECDVEEPAVIEEPVEEQAELVESSDED